MIKDIHIDLKISGEIIPEDLIEEWIKDCLYEHKIECIDIKKDK